MAILVNEEGEPKTMEQLSIKLNLVRPSEQSSKKMAHALYKVKNETLRKLLLNGCLRHDEAQLCYKTAPRRFLLVPFTDSIIGADITECLYDEIERSWDTTDIELFNACLTIMESPMGHKKEVYTEEILEELLSRYFWDTPDGILIDINQVWLDDNTDNLLRPVSYKTIREVPLDNLIRNYGYSQHLKEGRPIQL